MTREYKINVSEEGLLKVRGMYGGTIDDPLTRRKYIVFLDGKHFDEIGLILAKEENNAHVTIAEDSKLRDRFRTSTPFPRSDYGDSIETIEAAYLDSGDFRTSVKEKHGIESARDYVLHVMESYIQKKEELGKTLTLRDTVTYLTYKHEDILEEHPELKEGLKGLLEKIHKDEDFIAHPPSYYEHRSLPQEIGLYGVFGGGWITGSVEEGYILLDESSGSFGHVPLAIRQKAADALAKKFNELNVADDLEAKIEPRRDAPEKLLWIDAWMDFVELIKEKEVK